ncbi:acetolactate synthase 3 large subunit [Hyphomicrobiales bacterium]|jgi:acetolactate synthase I/II/III large subunit|nr:acetolactate synthase 3 large subunit [Rhodobiaceae bacterium]MBT5641240.1 acetolactate synthase 3 large subunit [Rhodobiaceae bacterium]MBT6223670.1 acetolactate synthase 3 large subunit [Rhodobiaceae bacterium]MDB4831258.1 acetolactate synthase 3 large subunit [Hyphomicrobiales bacterium]MDC0139762.1 acetolactate synthase 3 large subunit [Hyphomicrobiales bacterium]
MQDKISGAEMIIKAIADQGIDSVFGYPGGAVLPIYDAIFQQEEVKHILVRHEQGAGHAAEGYARSTGKTGVLIVTSGPGATNTVTALTDALLDSIPIVCISGQVPTHLIGSDAFQEADTVGITRACTKHNWLVKNIEDLPRIMHEAFYVAKSGRPGPVLVDVPKDIQFALGDYQNLNKIKHKTYNPILTPDEMQIKRAIDLLLNAKKPVVYSGGGVINSGKMASEYLTEFIKKTNYPITSTLMGLGAYPASEKNWLGMLGMHGTYEANMAMHDCDVMLCVGARFDDRITGKIDEFSPNSKKIHIDIDATSINKNIKVEVPIIGDCGITLKKLLELLPDNIEKVQTPFDNWWNEIESWRKIDCLKYKKNADVIMPQLALERLYEITKNYDTYITTEVGQHQMWAAQFYKFEKPNRWMTSGGLGTMGYGLPAANGVQVAHPKSLVIDIAGDASILMNIQELSTAVQYRLNTKVFILNNSYMGMVRQWQQLLHGNRLSESYSESLPDFVKLAEAYGATGIRIKNPKDLDAAITQMIETPGPVIVDCQVASLTNCFPMIPSGRAHNDMLLGEDVADEVVANAISDDGKVMV